MISMMMTMKCDMCPKTHEHPISSDPKLYDPIKYTTEAMMKKFSFKYVKLGKKALLACEDCEKKVDSYLENAVNELQTG